MNSWQLVEKMMISKGWNQVSMAKYLGKTAAFMTEVKKGRTLLPLETKLELAKALDYSEQQVFLWDREERAKTEAELRIIKAMLAKATAFFGLSVISAAMMLGSIPKAHAEPNAHNV